MIFIGWLHFSSNDCPAHQIISCSFVSNMAAAQFWLKKSAAWLAASEKCRIYALKCKVFTFISSLFCLRFALPSNHIQVSKFLPQNVKLGAFSSERQAKIVLADTILLNFAFYCTLFCLGFSLWNQVGHILQPTIKLLSQNLLSFLHPKDIWKLQTRCVL